MVLFNATVGTQTINFCCFQLKESLLPNSDSHPCISPPQQNKNRAGAPTQSRGVLLGGQAPQARTRLLGEQCRLACLIHACRSYFLRATTCYLCCSCRRGSMLWSLHTCVFWYSNYYWVKPRDSMSEWYCVGKTYRQILTSWRWWDISQDVTIPHSASKYLTWAHGTVALRTLPYVTIYNASHQLTVHHNTLRHRSVPSPYLTFSLP